MTQTLYSRPISGHETRERLRRFRLFLQLFDVSKRHLETGQHRLVVFAHDFIAHHVNLDGVFERMELETLFGWLCEHHPEALSCTAIDIGANIGNHALYFADHFERVIAFEPNPRTFRVLELNAELADNVVCVRKGLSDAERTAYMATPAGNVGHAHVVETQSAGGLAIELTTLDQAIRDTEQVRLIKVDVEGHELAVLRGAQATIRRCQPIVLFEQLAAALDGGGSPVVDLLRTYGYHRFAAVFGETRRPRGRLLARATRLLPWKSLYLGTEWSVRLCEAFDGRDYPFIIAIPDWLSQQGGPPQAVPTAVTN